MWGDGLTSNPNNLKPSVPGRFDICPETGIRPHAPEGKRKRKKLWAEALEVVYTTRLDAGRRSGATIIIYTLQSCIVFLLSSSFVS
jgi:hypothetical protein